jgi:hypothetical protein
MVRGGRAEAPLPRSDVSFRLHQKTGNFKVAKLSRLMQWSLLPEGKQKIELARTQFRFIKTIIIIRGGNYQMSFASISALHCSKRRQSSRWPSEADQYSGVPRLKKSKRINLPCRMEIMKINEGQRGAGGNYYMPVLSRLLTASASAITWQSTETPSPISAE